ncbi:Ribonuclease/ribotoxin [Podospora didyma]|uniref:Ribonuclease/ribotoxin n=1 Tax=Podospora didyma TaxID=330526 RepID=A0AAE0NTW5_9PEZI|nr:Ribonuclease/ribotoxin [Podospora didyma]
MVQIKSSAMLVVSLMGSMGLTAPSNPPLATTTPMNETINGTSTVDRSAALAGFKCHNTIYPGGIRFNSATVFGNVAAFPSSGEKQASGYPHEFTNFQNFVWKFNIWACSHHTLYEMPVFSDGSLYKWDKKRDGPGGQNPGPVRAIYTRPDDGKDFCGLVAHTAGNAGPFALCDEV